MDRNRAKDGRPRREISAGDAVWLDGAWWFFDSKIQSFGADGERDGEPAEYTWPLEFRELRDTPGDLVADLKDWEFLTSYEMKKYLDRHSNLESAELAVKQVDLHRRLAGSLASRLRALRTYAERLRADKRYEEAIGYYRRALALSYGDSALSTD